MTIADHELIDKQLEGQLSLAEAERFTERLASDPVFAQTYRTQREAIDTLRAHHDQELREEVRHLHHRVKARQQRRTRWYYAAAAVVLLSVGGAAAYWYMLTPQPEELYAAYYTVYPAQRVTRGTDTAANQRGIQQYGAGRYREAIPLLGQLAATDSLRDRAQLLLGNAYLQTEQWTEATRTFAAVAASDDALLRQQGQWYLALSYLRQGQWKEARPLLETLAAEGLYQKEASEMLRR